MPQFPAVNRLVVSGLCAVAAVAMTSAAALAQVPPNQMAMPLAMSGQAGQQNAGALPFTAPNSLANPAYGRGQEPALTQAELEELLEDPNSPQAKAFKLADEAEDTLDLFGRSKPEEKPEDITGRATPPEIDRLQNVHKTYGTKYGVSDDLISKEVALDMRRDAQREAALSYGARGGLSKRSYQIMERMRGYEKVLDKVFDFRQLLIKAPSGLLIEPPIVREGLDAVEITEGGSEAAVADQVLKISHQAKIVTAPRDWRSYLLMDYETEITPPPRVLWPKNPDEQLEWNSWVKEGWQAGYEQGDEIFNTGVAQMVSDYRGMVRYRMLLAQGKISQPYALHEDRGVTGGRDEMRVGDRALRITGPSQFLTGADLWKPADR